MEIIILIMATTLLIIYLFLLKKKWIIILSIVMYAIALILLSSMFITFTDTRDNISDCAICADIGRPFISPSVNYKLEVIAGHIKNDSGQYKQFRIRKIDIGSPNDDAIIYSSEDKFYTRHTTYLLWDNDDRVWVYSGDVGTFYWTKIDETNWQKSTYYDDESIGRRTIPAPDFLKKVHSKYHWF